MKIVIALIIFSILILFHELGHFLLARRNHIIVEEFSLGMGPRLLKVRRGTTLYSLKLLPFGGSCMMKGEDGEDEGEGSFNHASVWGRISVVAAGPIFNFILAFVMALIVIGVVGYDPAAVIGFPEGSPAATAGLKEGDLIRRLNGTHIDLGRDIYNYEVLKGLGSELCTLEVLRDGEQLEISYVPQSQTRYMLGFNYTPDEEPAELTGITLNLPMHKEGLLSGDVITAVNEIKIASGAELEAYFSEYPLDGQPVEITYERDGRERKALLTPVEHTSVELGFYYNTARVKTGLIDTLKYSLVEVKYWIRTTIQSLGMLFGGKVTVNDLSGPVGVVNVIGDTYESSRSDGALWIWMSMLNIMILLSANLGIMNLLPIPALDGGRLIFLLVEVIRGKGIRRETEGMIHLVGLMLLLALMVYVTFHDLTKIF